MSRVTPTEILELINKLPEAEDHIHICPIDGTHCVTSEWFAGSFAGRSFEGKSFEQAAQDLLDYMYDNFGHESIAGRKLRDVGFPNLDVMYNQLIIN